MSSAAAHRPVLLDEVIRTLTLDRSGILLDCTVGLGGHAEAWLRAAPPTAGLIGLDVDEDNLRRARTRLEAFAPRVRLFQANFSEVRHVLEAADIRAVDAVLADLGVASTQLDDPARGLSFQVEGPLDMRLDPRLDRSAADLVNALDERELADLIYRYGEERYSRRIARRIVEARREERIETTTRLARLVAGAIPAPARHSRRGAHPATRTFQALRIAVNDELASLERLLKILPSILAVGGKAAIISFHSLEDRLVKHAFADWVGGGHASFLTKKPILPTAEETAANPRSRSAKLRAVQRTDAGTFGT
ncbi:MAG: Ribosomal RNA small subunit methyltransferase H [Planctomycetes bacterium ADurb.Bin126]|nr:MAG: Ribosomal RNA small subunit methyltransferase H [Planctomycetes bacterium ADurb.Bin126]HOD81645.1 16S rRNA (cytosine(1402)-N(4))-methyltransferase RsmH [Phycisphaerae bacterium]HQL74776.1 16S rRNA (cytosine(1402)-N(4))-methyltransferase RsmH [Phycisphaerae bacterium]